MKTYRDRVDPLGTEHIFRSIMERDLEVSSASIKIPHKYDLPVSRVLGDASIQVHKGVPIRSIMDGKG